MTRFFEHGGDVADALARMAKEADVVWFDGHSDYGHSFEVFGQKWPDAVTPKTSLLILGDARTNYRALSIPRCATPFVMPGTRSGSTPSPGSTGAAATAPRRRTPMSCR